jgi:DNA processing protein
MPPTPLSTAERADWLRLIRSENVGPITFYQLLRRFGSAAAALAALPDLARRGGRAGALKICSRGTAEAELAAVERLGARLVAQCEPDYPRPLAAIEDAPPLIGVLGHVDLLHRPTVAIVGARNASANGRRIAELIAEGLSGAGYLVASGLARGIDAAAHRGALKATTGRTVAVVAGGLDIAYPPENAELMAEIARRGVVIAENPPGTTPQSRHFPRRNRLISGLSLGAVVVEAAAKSGSLITARMALDQGREVFAVPGSPLDPRCRGSNGLIRQGATLVENADDVLTGLDRLHDHALRDSIEPDFAGTKAAKPSSGEVENARAIILEMLGPDPVEVDELIRQCQFSASTVLTVLLEMELAGHLERHPGHRVSLLA